MNKFKKSKVYYAGMLKGMQTKCGNIFLFILGVFTFMFLCYLIYAHCTLRQSQEKIKQCYAEHIIKADTLYTHILNYNKDVVIVGQKTNDAILADSLIKSVLANTQHLSKAHSKKLQLVIENHFNQVEQLHNKYEEKLLRDSLRLCTERELLDGQTKTMIDLHLNKVEHEYSNITIWAAALTILFLVFSFYSIYKMDELIQQGDDGLKDIRRIRRESEQVKNQVEKETQALQEEAKTDIRRISARYMRNLINMYEEAKKEKEETFKLQKQEFDDLISTIKSLSEPLKNDKVGSDTSKDNSSNKRKGK